jgi:hypothetical protein
MMAKASRDLHVSLHLSGGQVPQHARHALELQSLWGNPEALGHCRSGLFRRGSEAVPDHEEVDGYEQDAGKEEQASIPEGQLEADGGATTVALLDRRRGTGAGRFGRFGWRRDMAGVSVGRAGEGLGGHIL